MSEINDPTIECGNCGTEIPITSRICPECKIDLYGDMLDPTLIEESRSTGTRKTDIKGSDKIPDTSPLINSEDDYDQPIPVEIVDFDIPFWSLVLLIIKIALAAIPALIILTFISLIAIAIFGGMIRSLILDF